MGEPQRLPLAVTMGDPAGIGPELLVKAWLRRQSDGLPRFVFVGARAALESAARALNIALPIVTVETCDAALRTGDRSLPVLDIPLAAPVTPGRAEPRNGTAVITAIERAVTAVVAGEAAAVVTNPIAKSVLYEAGFEHPGHTEFLAALSRKLKPDAPADPVMMIASDELNIVPLTIHIALSQVPRAITAERIVATARIMDLALRRDFAIGRPRIAITGLNPHAGEDGAMGREEIEVITPAIRQLRDEGLHVTGPHPADTLFHAARRATYDAVLAMYHDQALIPVKTLAFDRGVNVTLGLPFVRTSPDHGTAFDIAGRGTASPESLIAAMHLAWRMSAARAGACVP